MAKLKTNEDYFAYSKTLCVIPAEDLSALIVAHKIKVPFYIHRFVLKETIYPKVFQSQLYQTYTDELKYRLRGYHEYSLYLLEKLVTEFNLDFDAAKYKEIFFNMLFLNRELYGIKDHFIQDLDKLKYKYAVDFEKITYRDFVARFQDVFYQPAGYLDGVNLAILKDVLVHSCTLGDLRGIGEKYGVKIPRRINKFQLVDILAKRFRLSDGEVELLNTKSVLELEIYAKEKGFSISIDLKKSDMVEFLVFSLNLYHQEVVRDGHNYQVPLSADLDSVVIEGIDFVQNDQDIPVVYVNPIPVGVNPEPALEPHLEPVIEEEVVPIVTARIVEPEPVKEPVREPEPVKRTEPKQESVIVPEPEPQPEPVQPTLETEPLKEPEAKKTVPVPQAETYDFSDEERGLLDEKINQIIKKYNKKRHRKTFWTIFSLVIAVAVVGFAGYCAYYYFVLTPGVWPFNNFTF